MPESQNSKYLSGFAKKRHGTSNSESFFNSIFGHIGAFVCVAHLGHAALLTWDKVPLI